MDETTAAAAPIEIPVAAWLTSALGLLVLYVVLQENGALLNDGWHTIHEFFHDGRHVLGVPCH